VGEALNLSHRLRAASPPNRPRKRDDLDRSSPGSPQLGRRGAHRRPGRIHVVDQRDGCRRSARTEGFPDVRATGLPREATLWPHLPTPGQKRFHRQLPFESDESRQRLRRVLPAPEAAVRVGRDEGKGVDRRSRHKVGDEVRENACESPPPAFLPGGDERARRTVVRDRRAGRDEREPAASALGAAVYRPGRRRAAACAKRAAKETQVGEAVSADDPFPGSTRRAALRDKEIEESKASVFLAHTHPWGGIAGQGARVARRKWQLCNVPAREANGEGGRFLRVVTPVDPVLIPLRASREVQSQGPSRRKPEAVIGPGRPLLGGGVLDVGNHLVKRAQNGCLRRALRLRFYIHAPES
jgi:hypothetical protein